MILFTVGMFPFITQQILPVGANGEIRGSTRDFNEFLSQNPELTDKAKMAYRPMKMEEEKTNENAESYFRSLAPALPSFSVSTKGNQAILELNAWPKGFTECTIRSMTNEKVTKFAFFASRENSVIEVPLPEHTQAGMYWVEAEFGHNLLRKKMMLRN